VSGPPASAGGREILFEFVQMGAQVRVAAIDALSGAEAVVIGPVNAARADLERLALRKLMRLLAQDEDDEAGPPSGRGKLV
jgi:hypothetical protein